MEKLVDVGIYFKVFFDIEQSGLIFISNYHLDIIEEDNHKQYNREYIRLL